MNINNLLYQQWQNILQIEDHLIPDELPDEIAEIWQNCFILNIKVENNKMICSYHHIGHDIISAYKKDLDPDYDSPPLISEDPEKMLSVFEEIIYHKMPIVESSKVIYSANSNTIKYDQCMFPMKINDNLYKIIGAMKYKIS